MKIAMTTQRIVCDPKILGGKPVVAGTRVTVELILEKLGAGETTEDIVKAHPNVTSQGIQAALAYAAQTMKSDRFYPGDALDA